MKKWLSSVVIVLGLGVSASEAQYQRPVTNPYSSPGATPFYNPYLGGSSYGPILGNPGMLRPGTGTGAGPGVVAPGGLAPDATGAQAVSAFGNAGTLDPLLNDSTGHRTRFNSYSRYFNNQGGGGTFGTTTPGYTPGQNTNSRSNSRGSISVGARTPQGVGISAPP